VPGRIPIATSGVAENLNPYLRDAGAESERRGGARREIDDPSADVRTSIVNTHPHRLAVFEVGNPDLRSQWQGSVRGSQGAAVVVFSARRAFAVEVLGIYGRQALLRRWQRAAICNGCDNAHAGGGHPER